MKKSAEVLLYFGLDCGMMEFFYLRAAIQRTIDVSPAFMEYGLAKKIKASAHATREPNKQEDRRPFCMERLRTLKLF
jgi:hypothetical protein